VLLAQEQAWVTQ